MMISSNKMITTGCLLFSLLLGSHVSGAESLLLPSGVQYHRFASAVTNPEATWINPAGLAASRTPGIEYLGDYSDSRFLKSWGVSAFGDRFGLAYRHLDNFLNAPYDEYTASVGAELVAGIAWGGSYKYIKNGAGLYHKRHLWNVGLLVNRSTSFTAAAVFSNLNRGKINGEASRIGQLYSVSYKSPRNILTVSAEWAFFSEKASSDAAFHYGFEVAAIRGITFFANLDNDRNYQIGVKMNFAQYFVGNHSHYNGSNGDYRSTLFVGYPSDLALEKE